MKRVLVAWLLLGCETHRAEPPVTAAPTEPAVGMATASAWQAVGGDAALATTLAGFARSALAAGKKPYAYLHASWCEPCQAIEKSRARDPLMVDAFTGTAIATIDIDAADPKGMAAAGLRASAIPVFYRLGADGKPTGEKIDGSAWGDNVPATMAPPLKAFFAR